MMSIRTPISSTESQNLWGKKKVDPCIATAYERKKRERHLELQYSKSFPVEEKTISPISASHRVESS